MEGGEGKGIKKRITVLHDDIIKLQTCTNKIFFKESIESPS